MKYRKKNTIYHQIEFSRSDLISLLNGEDTAKTCWERIPENAKLDSQGSGKFLLTWYEGDR